jgi:hypothetical protein
MLVSLFPRDELVKIAFQDIQGGGGGGVLFHSFIFKPSRLYIVML